MRSWPASIFRSGWRPMLACAAWYVALIGLRFIPGMSRHDVIFMVVATISALLTTVAMMMLGSNISGQLELYPDRIVLGTRTLERQGLRVEVAPWKQVHLWTTLGSAIHLQTSRGSLWIGGRDRLFASRSQTPSTQKVDASLSADDFVQFVRALELFPDPLASTEATDALSIDLQPSAGSLRGAWRTMAPWLATMGVAGAIGMLAGTLPILQTGTGLIVIQVMTVMVVIGGLVFTMRKSMRPPSVRYRLLVEPTRVALCDLKSAGAFIDANVPRPKATRFTYRYSTRGGTFEFPALRLEWPSKSMVVGVWDTSIGWPAGTERTRKLNYLVGPEEWRRLVRTLGLG